jgi:TRAP-type uncharacterized transport system substrate-binding protein
MFLLRVVAPIALVCLLSNTGLAAGPKPQVRFTSEAERANDGVVSVISGTPGGTYFRMASELSVVLDAENKLRVLPVQGKGAGQNAYDLLYLKGIDVAFVRTDTIEQLKADERIRSAAGQVVYIARLFNDEMHILTKKDITDFRQLAGKRVSFDVKGSGSDYTGKAMFRGLGVDVDAVNVDQASAIQQLKRGDLAAVVSVAAKPVSVLAGIDDEAGLHLLSVPYPSTLADRYYPAELASADYPKLISAEGKVKTLAVGTILAAVNHPKSSERYHRLRRFTEAFLERFEEFKAPPRHPKWREVNLSATVPGWARFSPAEEWLERVRLEAAAKETARQNALRADIQKFLEQKALTIEGDREKILKDYLSWRASQERQASR